MIFVTCVGVFVNVFMYSYVCVCVCVCVHMYVTALVAVLVPVPMRVNVNLFSLECITWRVVVYELLTYVWIQHVFAVMYCKSLLDTSGVFVNVYMYS